MSMFLKNVPHLSLTKQKTLKISGIFLSLEDSSDVEELLAKDVAGKFEDEPYIPKLKS